MPETTSTPDSKATLTTSDPTKPSPRARKFYFGINGINTEAGNPHNWNETFARYIERETCDVANVYSYHVGTLDRWRKQAKHVKLATEALRDSARADDAIVLIGHSNGSQVCLDMLVAEQMLLVKELHLVAAAVAEDFDKNCLNEIVARNQVEKIILYCSGADQVLRWAERTGFVSWFGKWFNAKWGYGALGKNGAKNVSDAAGLILSMNWFDTYDHSTYWDPEHRADTFGRLTHGGNPPPFVAGIMDGT